MKRKLALGVRLYARRDAEARVFVYSGAFAAADCGGNVQEFSLNATYVPGVKTTAMCCLPGSELICRRSGGDVSGCYGGMAQLRTASATVAGSGRGVALLRDDSAFNIFEIIDNIGLKFADRRFIADNNPVTVHLQNAYRPHVVYAAFNRMVHSAGFLGPVAKIITSSASIIVPTPTVKAMVGTRLSSPSKSANWP